MHVGYWPPGAPRDETLEAFMLAYETLGYVACHDAAVEPGFEKIAIYCRTDQGALAPQHAAIQTRDGCWSSKLGTSIDIDHWSLDVLNGPTYGRAVCFMKRTRASEAIS